MNNANNADNPDRGIRLRSSGSSVNPSSLPEEFIDSMREAYKREEDPYAILATHAYIFCGMKINEIRDMFIISDRNRPRKASREYIRQKIVSMFKDIGDIYAEATGNTLVSPLYLGEEEHSIGFVTGGIRDRVTINMEDGDDESQDYTEEEEGRKKSTKRKGKAKAKSRPVDTDRRDSTDDRPWNPLSWLGTLKDKLKG